MVDAERREAQSAAKRVREDVLFELAFAEMGL
jgi:hypothetical protein